jgi:hypothetical protein
LEYRYFALFDFRERPNQTHERVSVSRDNRNHELLPESELNDRPVYIVDASPRSLKVSPCRLKRDIGKERFELPAKEPLIRLRYGILHRDFLSRCDDFKCHGIRACSDALEEPLIRITGKPKSVRQVRLKLNQFIALENLWCGWFFILSGGTLCGRWRESFAQLPEKPTEKRRLSPVIDRR